MQKKTKRSFGPKSKTEMTFFRSESHYLLFFHAAFTFFSEMAEYKFVVFSPLDQMTERQKGKNFPNFPSSKILS